MTKEQTKIPIQFDVLVLEDEEQVAVDIQRQLQDTFCQDCSVQLWEAAAPLDHVLPFENAASVFQTNNLVDARKAYMAGKCDLFIADYRVKGTPTEGQPTANCLSLLKDIKNSKRHIPVIGHTAYQDLFKSANEGGLVHIPVHKSDVNSTDTVVKHGIVLGREIMSFRQGLLGSFYLLQCAAAAESPIERQTLLDKCRIGFGSLTTPQFAPEDYRRSLLTLCAFVMRLSSVPSTHFGLQAISWDLITLLEPLMYSLASSKHSFDQDAAPVFQRMEASDYEVIMRIDI